MSKFTAPKSGTYQISGQIGHSHNASIMTGARVKVMIGGQVISTTGSFMFNWMEERIKLLPEPHRALYESLSLEEKQKLETWKEMEVALKQHPQFPIFWSAYVNRIKIKKALGVF